MLQDLVTSMIEGTYREHCCWVGWTESARRQRSDLCARKSSESWRPWSEQKESGQLNKDDLLCLSFTSGSGQEVAFGSANHLSMNDDPIKKGQGCWSGSSCLRFAAFVFTTSALYIDWSIHGLSRMIFQKKAALSHPTAFWRPKPRQWKIIIRKKT